MNQTALKIRNDLVRAMQESGRALLNCKNDEDVVYCLETFRGYKEMAESAIQEIKSNPLSGVGSMLDQAMSRLGKIQPPPGSSPKK